MLLLAFYLKHRLSVILRFYPFQKVKVSVIGKFTVANWFPKFVKLFLARNDYQMEYEDQNHGENYRNRTFTLVYAKFRPWNYTMCLGILKFHRKTYCF